MDFVPHEDDNHNWWAESYRPLPSEQWVEVVLGGTSYDDGTSYRITLKPRSPLVAGIPAVDIGSLYLMASNGS